MRRESEGPFGERLEGEIRSWLRDRDAGPAPDRLRMRVARVAEEAAAPRRRWVLLRPISAIAGAAAAALVILLAVTSRGPSSPLASGPVATAAPTPSASPYMLAQLPIGPWPRTGPVLAVPLDGLPLMLVVLAPLVAAVLLTGILVRRSVADARSAAQEPPAAGPWRMRSRRATGLRVAAVLVAALLVVVSCDLYQFSQSTPLSYANWEGAGSSYLGARGPTGGGPGEQYESFVPGGQIQVGIDLGNYGNLPLTVTSFDTERFVAEQPAGAFISSVELRLPASATMGGSYEIDQYTERFHPFELPAGGQTSLWLILHLKNCPSVLPGPTPAPNTTPNYYTYLPSTGYATFGTLPFRYSVLGIEREADVRLLESVGLVLGSGSVTC